MGKGNKYYTPELSEFCEEFEFEECVDGKTWDKERSYTPDEFIKNNKFELQEWISENRIRVKYLDQQDIEDCGFIPNIPVNVVPSEYIPTSWDYNGCGLCAEYPYNESKYQIRNENDDCLFDGTIKNKTELKKLLKMLGI